MSGLEIILKVNYYNIKDYSDFDEPVCIIDVVTNKGWASKGSKINYINYNFCFLIHLNLFWITLHFF